MERKPAAGAAGGAAGGGAGAAGAAGAAGTAGGAAGGGGAGPGKPAAVKKIAKELRLTDLSHCCLACFSSPALLFCTRCKDPGPEAPFEARYCRKECQLEDWKNHKVVCKSPEARALERAAAAAARARQERLSRLLWQASGSGEVRLVQGLIAQGAEVDYRNAEQGGSTALHAATQEGKVAVVDALVAAGCQLEAETSQGCTACYYAAQLNQVEVLRRLIRAGADVNRATSCSKGLRPLHVAAQNGHAAVIDCLLAARAVVDSCNSDGVTALIVASQQGKLEAVRSLIRGGAGVNLTCICPKGLSATALMLASQCNHPSVVEALLEAGADVNFARPESGVTALMLACNVGSEACVRALLAGGADPRMVAHKGGTALVFAKHQNHPAIAALLEAKLRELSAGGV